MRTGALFAVAMALLLGACTQDKEPWEFEAEMPLNGTLKYRN